MDGTVPAMATTPGFTGCVFLGLSVDGFIARPDGDLCWLISRGEAAGDAGFTPFMESVDALLMGRGSYDAIADWAEWPYLGRPVHVLSSTLPADADPGSPCTPTSTPRSRTCAQPATRGSTST